MISSDVGIEYSMARHISMNRVYLGEVRLGSEGVSDQSADGGRIFLGYPVLVEGVPMGDDRPIPCFFVHLFKVLPSIPARRAKMPIASRRMCRSLHRREPTRTNSSASARLHPCHVGSPTPTISE